MATFTELRDKIRDWSNRDEDVLNNTIVEDSMMWAADKAYRQLRVPPLEFIVRFEASQLTTENGTNLYQSITRIPIPANLIEFIQMRVTDANGQTTRVLNEKADIRTFRDMYAEKYNDFAFWTREGSDILMAPALGTTGGTYGSTGAGLEEYVELYYYGRLPRLDDRYEVNLANYNAGLLETATGTPIPIPSPLATSADQIPEGAVGQESPNWLRDENERVLVYGTLGELFSYLQEDEQAQKYMALFDQEIADLNDEDVRRNASGGNVQVNFNGRGLI